MAQKDIGNKTPLHDLKNSKEVKEYYNTWSNNNKYNIDMENWNYTGPKETVDTLIRYQKNRNIKVYDAGCGTGLVGIELKNHGFEQISGADISNKLLNQVPKGIYYNLSNVNLNLKINEKDNEYDVVMCVGTFTYEHVKPPALDEFLRITKNKGYICFTINENIYFEYKFDQKIKMLNETYKWKEIEFYKSNYLASKNVNAWLGLYEVIK